MQSYKSVPDTYARYSIIRDALKMSDGKVAAIAGLSRTTFGAWKRGEYRPKYDTVAKIAAVLDVSPGMILEGGDR